MEMTGGKDKRCLTVNLYMSRYFSGALFLPDRGSMFAGKNFDREKRKWMLLMQLSTAILLCSDAFAWEFRGKPGITGYYIVRVPSISSKKR